MLDLPNTTRINGNRIKWGVQGHGPPLIAVHGTPFSSQVWRRMVPYLRQHWTVYFFDLAGYGQSEMRQGQDVSLGVQNSVLIGLIHEWGLERPHVLAHDFGGATALRAYFLDGAQYASLTIFDAVALAPWGSPFVQHVRCHEDAFAGMPDYMHRAMLGAYLQTAACQPMTDDVLQIYVDPWVGEYGQPAFYRQIAQMDQKYTDELEPRLRPMDCPVTVMWGEEDAWIPPEMGVRLAELISDRPCRMVPGSGHLMQEDRPEAIVAALLAERS